ncbi:MAG: hypothetical protein GY777_19660 [Candidatus Brocadiaceae bacterium]|nr:hypothetical protein [Candidatus Brocadiaceae bacterium]
MTFKRILFFSSVILLITIVTVGSMILTVDSSFAMGRVGAGHLSGGDGSVRHSGGSALAMAHAKSEERYWEDKYVNEKEYNRQSAAIGSVHNSGEIIYYNTPEKKSPTTMTMNYRPGDGIPLPANVKREIETLRKSNLQAGPGDKQQELNDFMDNNWSNWKNNWDGYYGSLVSSTYVGSSVASLPEKHEVMEIREITYYYADGIYYASFDEIYVVVPPPNGALIKTIPPEYSTVTVNDTEHYNYGGVFYLKVDRGYQVIAPPTGGIVTKLPGKAYSTLINKDLYYVYGNAYYKRFFRGNSVIYKIVKAPTVK